MKPYSFSFERLAHFLISLMILTYLLIVGKGFLIPILFGMLLAFMLKPICDGLEQYISNRILAIVLTLVLVLLPLLGIIGLFSLQLINVFNDIGEIFEGLMNALQRMVDFINERWDLGIRDAREWLSSGLDDAAAQPLAIVGEGVTSSTYMLANLVLTIIYTFFFLLYRTALRNFILGQVDRQVREKTYQVLEDVQNVVQRYLYGLLLVIVILAILNSLGLWLIGINYAFFWGVLAACLAVIPYIGTTLGGFLPFVYAFATSESLLKPLLVVALYVTIQSIEGNFITPKVVGGSVHLNPFAAILSLILGGAIWGIAGMILALPLVAIVKITLESIEETKPLSLLLSDQLYDRQEDFLGEYDKPRYRLLSIFRQRNVEE